MQKSQTNSNYELYRAWREKYPVDILFKVVAPHGYALETYFDDATKVHGICDVHWGQQDYNGGVVFSCLTVPSILKTKIVPVLIAAGFSVGLLTLKGFLLRDAEIYNYSC
jgi:hypothetical protein